MGLLRRILIITLPWVMLGNLQQGAAWSAPPPVMTPAQEALFSGGAAIVEDMILACHEIKKTNDIHTELPDVFKRHLLESFQKAKLEGLPKKYFSALEQDVNEFSKPGKLTLDTWNRFHARLLAVFEFNYLKASKHFLYGFDVFEKVLDSAIQTHWEPPFPIEHFGGVEGSLHRVIDAIFGDPLRVRRPEVGGCEFAVYHDLGINSLSRAFSESVSLIGIASGKTNYDGVTGGPRNLAEHDKDHGLSYYRDDVDKPLLEVLQTLPDTEKREMDLLYFYDIHETRLCNEYFLNPNRGAVGFKPIDDEFLVKRLKDLSDLGSFLPPSVLGTQTFGDQLQSLLFSVRSVVARLGSVSHSPTKDEADAQKISQWLSRVIPKFCELREAVRGGSVSVPPLASDRNVRTGVPHVGAQTPTSILSQPAK